MKILNHKDIKLVSGGDTTRYVPPSTCTQLSAYTMYIVCGSGQITVASTGKVIWSQPVNMLLGVPYLVPLDSYEYIEVTKYGGQTGFRYEYHVVSY